WFLLQAEDGIRAFHVTGVQTCALPILAVEQLGFADVVVLSHVDEAHGASPAVDVDALQAELARHAPAAVMTRAARGALGCRLVEDRKSVAEGERGGSGARGVRQYRTGT